MGIRTIETGRFRLGGRRILLVGAALVVVAGGTMAGVALEGDGDGGQTVASTASDTLVPRFVEQVRERRLNLDEEAQAPVAGTNVKLQKSLDLFLTDPVTAAERPNIKLQKSVELFLSDEHESPERVNMKLVRSLDLLSDQ